MCALEPTALFGRTKAGPGSGHLADTHIDVPLGHPVLEMHHVSKQTFLPICEKDQDVERGGWV